MTSKSLHLNNLEHKLFWLLLVMISLVSFFYIYLINSSIINLALREDYEEEMSYTQTEVTDLVSEYMSLTNQLDYEQVLAFGFVDDASQVTFAVRGEPAVILTLGTDEI